MINTDMPKEEEVSKEYLISTDWKNSGSFITPQEFHKEREERERQEREAPKPSLVVALHYNRTEGFTEVTTSASAHSVLQPEHRAENIRFADRLRGFIARFGRQHIVRPTA